MGSDLSSAILDIARREHPDVEFEQRSVYEIADTGRRWDVVVACEVLEHLDEPERALEAMAEAANLAILVTVPREPIWRILNLARGQHVRRLGNSWGHVNHWSTGAFLAMLRKHVEVMDWRTPLPWTQALCRPRSTKAA
jgi:2-polyprenyl-3-methyl-5-hydroxy-6-metoxy-1,4-benzoquinol methylase